ncbi:hypothetical protein ASE63_07935 [Bosea sp. Root381]|uniref:flagellar hook-length control protein FliK n=1 Tax=Bosea sp. Root381 TaxID=1736524 RepID=UPI0006FC49B5|nr:flagellar hook-length control protein FliK [Bosea sp. Root381]KRE02280.1 hypothetical protein ASE63_07935 [Bosea sp. Root381]
MSLQPLLNSQPAAEPAAQRRRTAERDAGGEGEAFVLPREEPAKEASTPARANTRETVRDSGETRRAADEAGAAQVASPEKATKPVAAAPAEGGVKTAAGEPGKPAAQPVDKTPAVPSAAQNLDVAALISIAVAAEADPAKTVNDGAGKEDVGKSAEVETGELGASGAIIVAAEPKAESAPAVVAPGPAPGGIVPVGIDMTPPGGAAPSGEALPEDLLSGRAPATASGASALAVAQAAAAGLGLEATPSAATTVDGVPAAKGGMPNAAAEITLPFLGVSQAATQGEDKASGDPLIPIHGQKPAPGEVQSPSASSASSAASAPAEAKPEALQQLLNPIDLSALGQQGAARPEPLRIPGMPEPAAAQPLPSPQGQGSADGPPTPLHVLPIEIGLKALAGARQFDIRLDPGELGRVDVNLSISEDGEVSARMVVDRVETLHLLQRDARTLERAFEQAGLKPSESGVDITLRDPSDQSGFRQGRQQDEASQRARGFAAGSEQGEDNAIPAQPAPVRRFVRLGGVDLSV